MSEVKLYRKRPVIIKAIQWTGENTEEVLSFINSIVDIASIQTLPDGTSIIAIPTMEGVMAATVNDFIIRGVQGEFYPCKPGIFIQTYELVPVYTPEEILEEWDH